MLSLVKLNSVLVYKVSGAGTVLERAVGRLGVGEVCHNKASLGS